MGYVGANLGLVGVLVAAVTRLCGGERRLMVLDVMGERLQALGRSTIRVGSVLRWRSVGIGVPTLALAFFVRRAGRVSGPVRFLIFLLEDRVRPFSVIFLGRQRQTSMNASSVLCLPRVWGMFYGAFFSWFLYCGRGLGF